MNFYIMFPFIFVHKRLFSHTQMRAHTHTLALNFLDNCISIKNISLCSKKLFWSKVQRLLSYLEKHYK